MKYLALFSFFLSSVVWGSPKEEIGFIVSAGAFFKADPYASFYKSRIFIGEKNPPFVIAKEVVSLYENKDTVFVALGKLEPHAIIGASETKQSSTLAGFSGNSYQSYVLQGEIPKQVIRYLGAEAESFYQEVRTDGSNSIIAVNKNPRANKIVWPKNLDELRRLPGVAITNEEGSFFAVVRARPIGASNDRWSLIDRLKSYRPLALIELGSRGENRQLYKDQQDQRANFIKRSPSAFFPDTYEMATLTPSAIKDLACPTIYPAHPHEMVSVYNKTLHLWSVQGDEKFWPLYQELGQLMNIENMIKQIKTLSADPEQTLNIVRVFSEEAAQKAAKSVYVDAVFLSVSDPYAQLPTQETTKLVYAKTDVYEQIAPIIRISSLDITEVVFKISPPYSVQEVKIKRYPISEKESLGNTTDSYEPSLFLGLPALKNISNQEKPWNNEELEKISGGTLRDSAKADIALFEYKPPITPLYGDISFELAEKLLSPQGNVVLLTLPGKQIKRIAKFLSQNNNKKFLLSGIDPKSLRIGDRLINDNERFDIVIAEQTLLELLDMSKFGGLGDDYTIRAPFIEAIYGDLKGIYFIAGPKNSTEKDTENAIASKVSDLSKVGIPATYIIEEWLKKENRDSQLRDFLAHDKGNVKHVVTWDLSYLDFGLSKNYTNPLYDDYAKKAVLPMGRGGVPAFTHIFIFFRTALTYDAPHLVTTLSGELKYMHTEMMDKPLKDKMKIALKLRLPWERSLFKQNSIVLSPILESTYDTKLLPGFWVHNEKIPLRPKRLDSLLGFNVDFTKLGFNIDAGAVLANDFTHRTLRDGTDYGPGLNFFSKWSLFGPVELGSDISSYYLFPLPNNTITNKLALGVEGTVWLRLARFYDFSIAAVSDFLITTLQNNPKNFATSSIFGLTISYGRLFRLLG